MSRKVRRVTRAQARRAERRADESIRQLEARERKDRKRAHEQRVSRELADLTAIWGDAGAATVVAGYLDVAR